MGPISQIQWTLTGWLTIPRWTPRRGKGNLADKDLNVDTLTNSQDNFGRAKNNLFHAIEEVEKKALHVAEQLVHDEVDILFGKDHGQPIHDEKMQKTDLELIKPVKVRRLSTTPSTRKIKMTTEYVKSTHPHETTELPHGNFLDFMENYANHCHSQFGY